MLFILQAYFNRGGVEEHVKDLAWGLRDKYDIGILFPHSPDGQKSTIIYLNKGCIEKVYQASTESWPVSLLKNRNAEYAINDVISSFKPDLIHLHHCYNWHLGLMDQLRSFDIPIIKTFHDYFVATPLFTMEFSNSPSELTSEEYSNKVFGVNIANYLEERRKVFIRNISYLQERITPSNFAASEIAKIFPAPYKVIEHGIQHFNPRPKVKSNKIRFGYIGSLIRQKGIEVVLTAFRSLHKECPNTELLIFGGGNQYETVTEEGIKYFKNYSRKELPEITSLFDVGIIPSIFKETFCYTLSELLQSGTPVIASNIGAIPERLAKHQTGILFEAGNPNSLREAMMKFIVQDSKSHAPNTKVKQDIEMFENYDGLYSTYIGS